MRHRKFFTNGIKIERRRGKNPKSRYETRLFRVWGEKKKNVNGILFVYGVLGCCVSRWVLAPYGKRLPTLNFQYTHYVYIQMRVNPIFRKKYSKFSSLYGWGDACSRLLTIKFSHLSSFVSSCAEQLKVPNSASV